MNDYIKDQAKRLNITPEAFVDHMIEVHSNRNFRMDYSPWRHGGFYTNVRYPSGAVGCVSSAKRTISGKFEISCDPRPERGQYPTRLAAAHAERLIALDQWKAIKAEISTLVCDECGGTNIHCLEWVDVNTNEIKGTNENMTSDHRWCDDCQTHPGFITKADYEQSVADAELIS